MKLNTIVGLVLVILATNLFTYAATRYWTAEQVITGAYERAKLTMDKQKSGEILPSLAQSPESQVLMAIGTTEGLYFGEDAFIIGGFFAASLLVTGIYFVLRNAKAAKQD
jgi:hypothetical protein